MIDLHRAERVHAMLIAAFGGTAGTRDRSALDACLARPFQTFDGKELHPSPETKAAALLEGIVRHPWVDGNRRTAYVLMELLLEENGFTLNATQDEKYVMTMGVTEGRSSLEGVTSWITTHVRSI